MYNEYDRGNNVYCYDYGARFYDPTVSRFFTLDPKSETYSFQSPFTYVANNPILFIDKNGENPYALVYKAAELTLAALASVAIIHMARRMDEVGFIESQYQDEEERR
jgi:RHS repeat-associated protein